MKNKIVKTAVSLTSVAILAEMGFFLKTWLTYGKQGSKDSVDSLLDRFMPAYEVSEQHQIHVNAPAPLTFDTSLRLDLGRSAIVRLLFGARAIFMGSGPKEIQARPSLQLRQMDQLGWRILAEQPGKQLVLGAVARPWVRNSTFEPITSDEFASFNRPGFVKIIFAVAASEKGGGA